MLKKQREEKFYGECCGRYDTGVWGRCSNSKGVFDMRDKNDGSHVSLSRCVRDVNYGNGISDGKSISALIPNDCQGFCECYGTLWSMIQCHKQPGRNTSSISRIFKFFHNISQIQIPSVWRITVQPYKRGAGACAGRNTEKYFYVPKGFLLMTLGGVQEPYTPSMNNTYFIVGARSFSQVFEGTVTATFLTQVSQINSRWSRWRETYYLL